MSFDWKLNNNDFMALPWVSKRDKEIYFYNVTEQSKKPKIPMNMNEWLLFYESMYFQMKSYSSIV